MQDGGSVALGDGFRPSVWSISSDEGDKSCDVYFSFWVFFRSCLLEQTGSVGD